MEVLKVQKLSKEFDGIKAVNELTFSIKKGTIVSLIGPNGAGKTTLFNVINGFYRPERGEVYFKGDRITNNRPFRIALGGIGRTFQNIRIFPGMTVFENLMLSPQNQIGESFTQTLLQTRALKTEEEKIRGNTLKYLHTVGLSHKKDAMAENLSHGQKKLLELARGIATNAELLLLDEPTSGVFPEMREKILRILIDLKKEGKTIIFIEHDMKVVMGISDRIIVMNYGGKIAEGIPEEVKNNVNVVKAYLG